MARNARCNSLSSFSKNFMCLERLVKSCYDWLTCKFLCELVPACQCGYFYSGLSNTEINRILIALCVLQINDGAATFTAVFILYTFVSIFDAYCI